VAILAARGYSLVEIGFVETVFHITSLIFEIPSGVLADVFGRKRMLLVSTLMQMVGNVIMIASTNLFMVCLSIVFMALSYNFSSGSGDALAYDSLKMAGQESRFERYESNQLTIYRLCDGLSTLCAGFALTIGHRLAYGTDLITGAVQLMVIGGLSEICPGERGGGEPLLKRLARCFRESFAFVGKASHPRRSSSTSSVFSCAVSARRGIAKRIARYSLLNRSVRMASNLARPSRG
jgi:MFS family permease